MFNSFYITLWHTSSLSVTLDQSLTRSDAVHMACFGEVNLVVAPAILRIGTEWKVCSIDPARIVGHKLEILLLLHLCAAPLAVQIGLIGIIENVVSISISTANLFTASGRFSVALSPFSYPVHVRFNPTAWECGRVSWFVKLEYHLPLWSVLIWIFLVQHWMTELQLK